MKRGEIWTVAGGTDYAGKPRPVVILPNADNGLRSPSRLMADKITTVALTKLGSRVGHLDANDMARLSRSVILFLNLVET